MSKKNQQKSRFRENGTAGEKKAPPARPASLVAGTGATLPHNAKKEALGPNTDRNA